MCTEGPYLLHSFQSRLSPFFFFSFSSFTRSRDFDFFFLFCFPFSFLRLNCRLISHIVFVSSKFEQFEHPRYSKRNIVYFVFSSRMYVYTHTFTRRGTIVPSYLLIFVRVHTHTQREKSFRVFHFFLFFIHYVRTYFR